MKKSSIFFLVFSVILIITGFILRNSAINSAEKQNIELFKQSITEKGDLVETLGFSSKDTNRISITISSGTINVIGNSDKSYVEIINYNPLEYVAYPNNRSFTIQDDIVSSLMGRAEGGNISFNGLRDYLRFEKHNSDKIINIYVASDAELKRFDIVLGHGNINIDNANIVCDYNLTITKGNINCTNTKELSNFSASIKNGNIKLDKTYVQHSDISIENGNIVFTTPSSVVYDYNIENETGSIVYNSETHKGAFVSTNEGANGNFIAHVGVGKITVTTFEEN